jgi:AraC-like DNA-binding protein
MKPGFQKPTVRPGISISGPRAAYVGPGLDLAPHRNSAATIALALETPFELTILDGPAAAPPAKLKAALIAPDTRHHLRAPGPMCFVYLDALSDDHETLKQASLAGSRSSSAIRMIRGHDTIRVDDICEALGVPGRAPPRQDIAKVIRQVDLRPQDFASVTDAARIAGLSPSRFQALFRQSVGMPFRHYRQWRRMAIVMKTLSAGQTLTAAAMAAGFSSSAHLSTTFKTMFGITPSQLVRLGVRIDVEKSR